MSGTLNSRIFLFIMVLAVFLLSFNEVTTARVETKTYEVQVERVWCCHDGEVFQATPEECRERGGQFFPTREEAEEHCRERPHEPGTGILQIPDLKRPGWEKYVGKTVTTEGIFVRDPTPMLITDIKIVLANMPMPKDQYILLTGNQAK
ncbi:MAG: hypothetical protein PVH61_10755 [Candidatus Aminicenantes bacterium]|jgi:hypothetical protein